MLTETSAQIGMILPQVSRQWNLELFTNRHERVYGEGHVVAEAWPERNIHSDQEAAEREGLPDAVGSAPQFVAQIHRSMMMAFGTGWIQGGRISVKMIKPVYPSDFTTAKGRIVGLELQPDGGGEDQLRARCETWVEKRDGTKVMVGSASAMVPKR